jgi:hypothetical protein
LRSTRIVLHLVQIKDPQRRAAALTFDFHFWSSHPSCAVGLFSFKKRHARTGASSAAVACAMGLFSFEKRDRRQVLKARITFYVLKYFLFRKYFFNESYPQKKIKTHACSKRGAIIQKTHQRFSIRAMRVERKYFTP